MTTYTAYARKWAKGWELHIPDVGVTQSKTLASAATQVHDYLCSMEITDTADLQVEVRVELGEIQNELDDLYELRERVERDRARAARKVRDIATQLRAMRVSVTDIATILNVSRGRVTQLL